MLYCGHMENENGIGVIPKTEIWKKNFENAGKNWVPKAKVCAYCGKEYMPLDYRHQSERYKFCSKECQHKYHSVRKRMSINGYDRICVICGKPFHTNSFQSKTCSKECSEKRAYEMHHPHVHKVDLVKTCLHCGKEFHTNNHQKKYCSPECKRAYYEAHGLKDPNFENFIKKDPVTKTCDFCGKEFTTTRSNKRFCSDKCKKRFYSKKEHVEPMTKVCPHCGKEFKTSNNRQKYCSSECREAYCEAHGIKTFNFKVYVKKGPTEHVCKNCGKTFLTNNGNQRYCSPECKSEYYAAHGIKEIDLRNLVKKEQIEKTCPICGTKFLTAMDKKTYCSRECKRKAESIKYRNEHKSVVYTKTCKTCGKEFTTTNRLKLYCSKDCYNNAPHIRKYLKKEPPKPRKCELCGKEFIPSPTHPKQRFCSKDCQHKAQYAKFIANRPKIDLHRKCAFCGKEFDANRMHPNQKCCSISCRWAYKYYGGKSVEEVNKIREERKLNKINTPTGPRVCRHCGKEFIATSTGQRYCSDECRKNHTRKTPVLITKTCKVCGKEFQTNDHRRTCCSRECSYIQRSRGEIFYNFKKMSPEQIERLKEKRSLYGKKITATCVTCGNTFEYEFKGIFRKYCSKSCQKKMGNFMYDTKHELHHNSDVSMFDEPKTFKGVCQNPDCQKEFEYTGYSVSEKRYCSDECMKHHHSIIIEQKRIERNALRNEIHNEILRIKNLSGDDRKAAFYNLKTKITSRKKLENINKLQRRLDEREFKLQEKLRIKEEKCMEHSKKLEARRILLEQKRLRKEENNEIRLQKKISCQEKVNLLKEENRKRELYWRDHPEEYAKMISEKNERMIQKRIETAAKKRKISKEKQRAALRHMVQRARAKGIKIGYATCNDCGSKFAYVAELFKTDRNGNVISRCDLPEHKIPIYCCKTCRSHHRWEHGERERVKRVAELKKIGEYKKEIITVTWRGQHHSYGGNTSKTTLDNTLYGYNIGKHDECVDLSEQFNMYDEIDQY